MAINKPLLRSIFLIALLLLIGSIIFAQLENLPLFDSLWLTLVTLLTIGYGDIIPTSTLGKIFAIFFVPLGIIVLAYTSSIFISFMIEGNLSNNFARKKMENKIKKLKNHYIVCGYGRVGAQVVEGLLLEEKDIVVIENDPLKIKNLPDNVIYLLEDAIEDNTLLQAGISQAAGIVASLPQDGNNLLITLTARELSPDIYIVVRSEKEQSESKLRRAGANMVINPSSLGGRKMAHALVQHDSGECISLYVQTEKELMFLKELKIIPNSILIDKTLLEIRKEYSANIISIKRGFHLISTPKASEKIFAEDTILVWGKKEVVETLEKFN